MKLCRKYVKGCVMTNKNNLYLRFSAISQNEAFARVCVASFLSTYNPTLDELCDIKTAISEAVTNCVVHAYPEGCYGEIEMFVSVMCNEVYVRIKDNGVGISDISKAKQPFFTTKPSAERSGMGFTVMEGFMDKLIVSSTLGCGTIIEMYKTIGVCNNVVCGAYNV